MNSLEQINNNLYREIKSGKEFDKYFPDVPCKSTFLEQTTSLGGLALMKLWSKKYSFQTSKIASFLKGRTLPETINNIYNWLYNYIQYDADGYYQIIKSPACAWKIRDKGIDCKSYALFASSILSNLGIKHKFRKVVQSSAPTRWSHVYVVVEYNGREFIVDATKSINTEVQYIKKEDMHVIEDVNLPYFGMNAALGGRNIDHAVRNFKQFLSGLQKVGVPSHIIMRLKADVKNYIDSGIEPRIRITREFVEVEGKKHLLEYSGMNAVAAIAAGAGKKAIFSAITKLVGSIDLGNILDRGFGQVFDNGFDFSCWRASFPPTRAEAETNAHIKKLFDDNKLLEKLKTKDLSVIKGVFNILLGQLTFGKIDREANWHSTKGCTQKGEKKSYEIFKKAEEELYKAIESDFKVTYHMVQRNINFKFRGGSIWRKYRIREVNNIQFRRPPVDVPVNSGEPPRVGNPTPSPVQNPSPTPIPVKGQTPPSSGANNPPKSKSNTGILIAAALAVGGAVMLS